MGTCNDGIFLDIVSDCTTQKSGGLEVVAYAFYRPDAAITYSPTMPTMITSITMATGKKAIEIRGIKKLLNSGHNLVSAEDRPDKYAHFFNLQQFEVDAADIENIDKMGDMVVIYERISKTTTGEGVFVVRGAKMGLYKSADDKDENNVDGARVIALSSQGGNEEPQSEYTFFLTDYATTKAAIIALKTPGA